MIKQLLQIRDGLIKAKGSIDEAIACLDTWFGRGKGVGHAYEFFVNQIGNWPWKPILWKSCIVFKHRFILWLLSHGKLLNRDPQCYIEDKVCVLCKNENESMHHLFFQERFLCMCGTT